NYLSVTSNAANGGVQSDAKIVSSFNRSSSGAISLGTIDINLESTKLFDSGLPAVVKNQGTLDRQTSVYSTAAAQALYDAAYATALAGGGTDAAANTAGQTAAAASTATKIDNVSAFNLDITAAGVTDDIITQMIGKIDNVMAQLTDQATILGSAK
ncbi:MAG: flagellin, partial [Mesorhizobium sp.]